MPRTVTLASLTAAAALALVACGDDAKTSAGGGGSAAKFPMTITNCAREVTFDKRPERVLTMGPEAATLVAAAGATDKIVARASEFDLGLGEYGPELAKVRLLSPDKELSKEAIVAQDPDLVVHYGIETPPEDLEAAGIHSIAAPGRCTPRNAQGFDEIFGAIMQYGRLLGTEEAAKATVDGLRKRVAAVVAAAKANPAGRTAAALIFSTSGPLGAYGRYGTVHDQMEAVGLENVFADQPQAYYEVNTETLLAADPDVLVLLSQKIGETKAQAKRTLFARKELRQLKAIRHDDIIVLFYEDTSGAPIAVKGLETMAARLAALR